MNAPLAIDVTGLSKQFGAMRVVDGLNLAVPRGQICGFLGGNGSGKTTTMRLLCGLLTPDAGGGTCLGRDIRRDAVRLRREIGYMTQRFGLYADLTVAENLLFVARMYALPTPEARVADMLARVGLHDRARQLAAELSGGWKQRLSLAACMLHTPKLLLLDEPTAGVDAKARREFWDQIVDMAADGMTVLVSTHYMDEAERCDRIVYMASGRLIVQGQAHELVARSGLSAYEASGPGLTGLVRRARGMAGVESATIIGGALRAVGTDEALLAAAAAGLAAPGVIWRPSPPRLDDVFLHLLRNEAPSP